MSNQASLTDLQNRVTAIRHVFVEFDRFAEIREDIRLLVNRDNETSEGGVMALFGVSRSGKTKFLLDCMREYKEADQKQGRIADGNGGWADPLTVAYMRVPDNNVKTFVERMHGALGGQPRVQGQRRYDYEGDILHLAAARRTRLMVLDECHQAKSAREIAEKAKDFSNAALFSILVVGTKDAEQLLRACPELGTRCMKKHVLKPFDWSDNTDNEDCLALLDKLDHDLKESIFGRLSGLADVDLAARICFAADGIIGHMAMLIELAGIVAVREMLKGTAEQITMEHFAQAFGPWHFGEGRPNPFIGRKLPEKPPLALDVTKVFPSRVKPKGDQLFGPR